MTIYRTDSDSEALFRSYPYAVYYVQSPSSVSHANSAEIRNINHESVSETFQQAANRLALSRYSSSHGSTNSFLHEKKIPYDDVQSHGTGITYNDEINRPEINMVVVDRVRNGCSNQDYEYDDYEDEEYFERKDEWWRMFSLGSSSSGGWKFLQITWRFILSMVVALVVFYIVTKPPAPKMSVKVQILALFLFSMFNQKNYIFIDSIWMVDYLNFFYFFKNIFQYYLFISPHFYLTSIISKKYHNIIYIEIFKNKNTV